MWTVEYDCRYGKNVGHTLYTLPIRASLYNYPMIARQLLVLGPYLRAFFGPRCFSKMLRRL